MGVTMVLDQRRVILFCCQLVMCRKAFHMHAMYMSIHLRIL